jgi:hypothetical protein
MIMAGFPIRTTSEALSLAVPAAGAARVPPPPLGVVAGRGRLSAPERSKLYISTGVNGLVSASRCAVHE